MKVYVKSQSGKWLMPTNPANAGILLKQGKAKLIQRTPFAVQLLYETTEHIQPVTVGIDDGGIYVGIAAVSPGQSLFQQEVVLRSDIKSKLDTRRQYRRSSKKYQHGDLLYHKNFKQACLVRDKFKCRVCGAESKLQCHHIKPRADGGRDKLSNLMTLCEACHEKHHKDGLKLPKQKSAFYISAAYVQQGKNYLQAELSRIAPLRTTFGYITAHHRNKAGIKKSHINDAVIIADKQANPLDRQIQTKHVQSRKRSLHEATARKGRKAPNRTQKRNNKNVFTLKGFNRWDTVQYKGRVGFICGFTGTSSCRIVDIKGNYMALRAFPW